MSCIDCRSLGKTVENRAPRLQARAFTLIELLVVIAIIAILAAMLMPALEDARAAARETSCRMQLHNIYLGFQMYSDSYDGVFPGWLLHDLHDMYSTQVRVGDEGYPNWPREMHKEMVNYVNPQLFMCPDFKAGTKKYWSWAENGSYPSGWWAQSTYVIFTGHTNYYWEAGNCCSEVGPDDIGYPMEPYGEHGCWYGANRHVYTTRDDRSPSAVMFMDRGWAVNGSNACYEPWGCKEEGLSPYSNHRLKGANAVFSSPKTGMSITRAAGVNALLYGGSVEWLDYTGTVHNYHRCYYRRYYVDHDLWKRLQ